MDHREARDIPRDERGDSSAMRHLDVIAHLLDRALRVPGTNWRFGLDPLMGLVPGLGDVVSMLLGAYSFWIARQVGAPPAVQGRMLLNLALDGLIGLIPIAGDLFDFAFKAHSRNHALLKRWMQTPHDTRRSSWLVLIAAAFILLLLLGLTVWLLIRFVQWAAGLLT